MNAKINGENEQIEALQESLKKTEANQGSLGREMRECENRLSQVQDEKADKDAKASPPTNAGRKSSLLLASLSKRNKLYAVVTHTSPIESM